MAAILSVATSLAIVSMLNLVMVDVLVDTIQNMPLVIVRRMGTTENSRVART